MSDIKLDVIDRKLLSLLQSEFPLTREPYADLGERLGIVGDEVMRRIARLKEARYIRQISPVLDVRSLGYQSTLVAMKVDNSRVDGAAQVIIKHPGVSHGYERDHPFNFWFTLAVPPEADMEAELKRLAGAAQAEAAVSLPATKLFKIGAYFAMDGDSRPDAGNGFGNTFPQQVKLSQQDRLIINQIQQDLPLVPGPFTEMAAKVGMEIEDFLSRCRELKERGIMRRFSASVNHYKAGFTANAMTCWIAPPDMVDAAGRELASLREVSHCYERKTDSLWPYNLFAMIHEHSREACRSIADEVSRRTGLRDYVMLFSTREFKKTRVKYPV